MPVLPIQDYYALLGVHATADAAELRRAWRRLASQWHPDRAGEAATATFQMLSAAYTVLSDPVARAAYDRRRRRGGTATPAAKPAPPSPPPGPAPSAPRRASAPAVMLRRLTGHLSALVARGAAHLDEPGFITLMLNDREAAEGGMATIALWVDLRCPDCRSNTPAPACRRCGGTGVVQELYSAWLAIRPGATAGEVLNPSAQFPGVLEPVRFPVQLRHPDAHP